MAMEAQARVVAHPFDAARAQFGRIVAALESPQMAAMTHADVERYLAQDGNELLRLMYQAFLDVQGDGRAEGPVRGTDGAERTHLRLVGRNLESSFGTVRVERWSYDAPEAKSLRPLDAELNLPKGLYSLPVRQRIVEEAAKVSFDESVGALAKSCGASVPKRQAEELVVRAAQDFDAFYSQVEREAALAPEESGPIVVLTTDGKGVVMRIEDLRDDTRRLALKRERKLTTRLCKGEKRNAKRMAQVAAVYTIEPFVRTPEDVLRELKPVQEVGRRRPRPERKRTWASVKKSAAEVIDEAYAEALRRDPRREKTWAVLVDGNREQMKIVTRAAEDRSLRVTTIVDFIHALEYVWGAGPALLGEANPELDEWVQQRALRLLRNEASSVAAGIRRAATLRGLTGWRRTSTDKCANYLLSNRESMRYADYLAQGLPIATGVIEGACRHLIKDRMDLTGARWRLERAEAVLQIRALRTSGDFEAYWRFHESMEQRRNHCAAYFGREIPTTRRLAPPRATPQLRVVAGR
jgi:hypothetical protein